MNLSRERLLSEAATLGFRPEILEKVARLLSLLDAIRKHPHLNTRVALKGGTALNLFLFNVPRLSVDIDLNYVGEAEREAMLQDRPAIERAIEAVCHAEALSITRVPEDFAGGKWRMRYQSVLGQNGNIEVDINFMYRIPLWPVQVADSRPLGFFAATRVPMLDLHEIAAGKLVALFARRASRDLFDAHALLTQIDLDTARLRTAFVAIGAMNRVDWRTITIESIGYDATELRDQLAPVLRATAPQGQQAISAWANDLMFECSARLARFLPFTLAEREFLDRLLDHGELRPALITSDSALAERLARHPQLAWKAQHVRKYFHRRP